VERQEREADHSPPSIVDVNMGWSYVSTEITGFMAWKEKNLPVTNNLVVFDKYLQ
jgi:hypothetical protein